MIPPVPADARAEAGDNIIVGNLARKFSLHLSDLQQVLHNSSLH